VKLTDVASVHTRNVGDETEVTVAVPLLVEESRVVTLICDFQYPPRQLISLQVVRQIEERT